MIEKDSLQFAIDAGNTRVKLGVFDGLQLISQISYPSEADHLQDQVLKWLKGFDKVSTGIVSSVIHLPEALLQGLALRYRLLVLDHTVPLPFINLYDQPETLGTDRMAVLAAAHALHPQKACMIINTGTAITYDYLSEKGEYHGGAISPGLNMRFKALHTFTSRLPLLHADEGAMESVSGRNTKQAIRAGVMQGSLMEIRGFIGAWLDSEGEGGHVLLSGGDSKLFVTDLKSSIFAPPMEWLPDLVLTGLNGILIFNDV